MNGTGGKERRTLSAGLVVGQNSNSFFRQDYIQRLNERQKGTGELLHCGVAVLVLVALVVLAAVLDAAVALRHCFELWSWY